MTIYYIFLLLICIVLQGTVTSVPLALVVLLVLIIMNRSAFVFVLAFIAGLLLDAILLFPLGLTSMFFLGFLFLVLLYQRKYEIYTIPFAMIASFSGSFIYLFLLHFENIIVQSIICAAFSFILIGLLQFKHHPKLVSL